MNCDEIQKNEFSKGGVLCQGDGNEQNDKIGYAKRSLAVKLKFNLGGLGELGGKKKHLRNNAELKPLFNHLFQFHIVFCEISNAFSQFVRGHGIFVEHPAESFF